MIAIFADCAPPYSAGFVSAAVSLTIVLVVSAFCAKALMAGYFEADRRNMELLVRIAGLEDDISNLWFTRYSVEDHCGLCGNAGVIDTRGKVATTAGKPCGGLFWCICPNGQALAGQLGDKPDPASPWVADRVGNVR